MKADFTVVATIEEEFRFQGGNKFTLNYKPQTSGQTGREIFNCEFDARYRASLIFGNDIRLVAPLSIFGGVDESKLLVVR